MILEKSAPRESGHQGAFSPRLLILVALSLFVLTPITVLALVQHGVVGVFASVAASSASLQIYLDLVIVCLLASVWMWRDSRRTGRRFLPWFALTLAAGSFGPLLYLLVGWLRSRRRRA